MEKTTHKILVDVYFVEHGTNLDGDLLREEAVPAYEFGDEGPSEGDYHGFLYIEAGTEGWFEDGEFESVIGSNTRVEEKYIEKL